MNVGDADVIVVGAGPVGLMLTGLLAEDGRRVVVLEASTGLPERSMAIGIAPPSLEILDRLDLASSCIEKGVRVQTAVVHERRRVAGRLRFDRLSPPYRFVLTLPQSDTVRLLRERVRSFPGVQFLSGRRVAGLEQDGRRVVCRTLDEKTGEVLRFSAPLAAGCDGAHGRMRDWLGLRAAQRTYAPLFRMADYPDRSGLGDEAHLFFGPERPVESFPLPGGRRRWIVRRGRRGRVDLTGTAEEAIERLTGAVLDPEEAGNESEFRPAYALARRYYRGRAALCGDAAHVMSPIGGQGMNTGFADAACLARAMGAALDGRLPPENAFREYERVRRRAFRVASRRSALGMGLGAAGGAAASRLRGALVSLLLEGEATGRFAARWFAMRSLPHPLKDAAPA